MYTLFAALLSFVFFALPGADEGRVVTLTLPHALGAGEAAFVELKVGAIERGAEIEISTTTGQSLGVISPFGIHSGDPAGTYTVPVPPNAISDKHVSLRLTLRQYGAKRAPTSKEVISVRLRIAPVARRTHSSAGVENSRVYAILHSDETECPVPRPTNGDRKAMGGRKRLRDRVGEMRLHPCRRMERDSKKGSESQSGA